MRITKVSTPFLPLIILDTGYAFSGEKGNDKLITDNIASRFQDALTKQLFAKSIMSSAPVAKNNSINEGSFIEDQDIKLL